MTINASSPHKLLDTDEKEGEKKEAEFLKWTRPNPFSFSTRFEKKSLFQAQFNVPSGKVNASPSLCLVVAPIIHFNPLVMSNL